MTEVASNELDIWGIDADVDIDLAPSPNHFSPPTTTKPSSSSSSSSISLSSQSSQLSRSRTTQRTQNKPQRSQTQTSGAPKSSSSSSSISRHHHQQQRSQQRAQSTQKITTHNHKYNNCKSQHQAHNITKDGFPIPNSRLSSNHRRNHSHKSSPSIANNHHLSPPKQQYPGHRQMSLDWLLTANGSKVLTPDEIQSVVHVAMLCGADRDIAKARRDNIEQHNNYQETRKWCGLCKYDSADRVAKIVEQLQACKKKWDQEMIAMYQAKTQTKEIQEKKTKAVAVVKGMQSLLFHYRDLIKICRARAAENKRIEEEAAKNKRHRRISNGSNHSRGYNNNNNNNRGESRRKLTIATHHAFDCYGLPENKWNFEMNPDFFTLFRGHNLDEDDYNYYNEVMVNERLNENGSDLGEYTDNDSDIEMDRYSKGINDNCSSLLGATYSKPPGLDSAKQFRSKNEHLNIFSENMKLLYGNDCQEYLGRGRYNAHLLSSYDIMNKVGSGVYGQVFRAKTKNTQRLVAIKTLQLIMSKQQKDARMKAIQEQKKRNDPNVNEICPFIVHEGVPVPVIREITGLKQLNHINITRLYDIVLNDPKMIENLPSDHFLHKVTVSKYNLNEADTVKWNLHLVQEFVPNELYAVMRNLKAIWLEQNKGKNNNNNNVDNNNLNPESMPSAPNWFSCANIKSILHDLLTGLDYLMSKKYVHRDLKPANLLLTDDGIVKIADFGLSRPKYRKDELLTNARNVVTRYYRAPEILVEQNKRKSSYSFASDMWSVGTIFAELLCGRPIFRAPSDMEQIFHIIHKCGKIDESVWKGISKISTDDPVPNKTPTTDNFNFLQSIPPRYRKTERWLSKFLRDFIKNSWSKQNQDTGLDLLDQMLCYDPAKRITPADALKHKFFTMTPKKQAPIKLIAKAKLAKKSSHTDLQQEQEQHQMAKQQRQQRQQQRNQHNQHNPPPPNHHNNNHNNNNNRSHPHHRNGNNFHYNYNNNNNNKGRSGPNTQSHQRGDNRHRGFNNQRNGIIQRGVNGHTTNNYNNRNRNNSRNNNFHRNNNHYNNNNQRHNSQRGGMLKKHNKQNKTNNCHKTKIIKSKNKRNNNKNNNKNNNNNNMMNKNKSTKYKTFNKSAMPNDFSMKAKAAYLAAGDSSNHHKRSFNQMNSNNHNRSSHPHKRQRI